MEHIKRCDRCGARIDLAAGIITMEKSRWMIVHDFVLGKTDGFNFSSKRLCKKCMKSYREWLRAGTEEENEMCGVRSESKSD